MIHVRLFSTQGINIYALKKQSNVTLTNHVFLNNVPIFYTSQSISPKNSIYTIYQIKLNLNRGTKIKIKSILKLNYFHFLYSIFYTIMREIQRLKKEIFKMSSISSLSIPVNRSSLELYSRLY